MRFAPLRLCLSASVFAFLFTLAPAHASLAYSVKNEGAQVFRTDKLEPPPLASLGQGEVLKLIQRGPAGSLVESEGGVKGWMRNSDLLAMQSARGQDVRLGDQVIAGEAQLPRSIDIIVPREWDPDLLPLDRSFGGDIVEPMDREQTEMRHDEN